MSLENPIQEIYPILNSDGFVIFIEGRKDRGKTDISLLLAEICYLKRFRTKIATNIWTESYIVERQITNIPDLQEWLESSGRKLFILDEAGKHIGKLTFMSKKNRAIMEAIQMIRHYDCGFICCAPSRRFIDSGYLDSDIIDLTIRKYRKDYAVARNHITGNSIRIFNVPRTSINFKTKDIAELELTKKPILTDLPLCCQVAAVYSSTGSYKNIKMAFNLKSEEVRRLMREHCRHSIITSHNTQGGIAIHKEYPEPQQSP